MPKNLGIHQETTIFRWIHLWDTKGFNGLKHQKRLPRYSSSFKMRVIIWLVKNKASYPQTTKHFGISNEGIVWSWRHRYDVYGAPYSEDESIIKDIEDIRNDPKMIDALSLGYCPLTQYINQKRIKRNKSIINYKRILRVMKQNGLLSSAYSRKTNKYNSFAGEGHKNHIKQRFITDRSYQNIGTDVTEIRWGKQTTDERLFVSLFCDFYSGEIMSYSISLHPTTEFVLKSLYPGIELAKGVPYLTTIYSDQGIQYQSNKYQMILRHSKIRQSMSRKGTPYDNSPTESLIHKMKIGDRLKS